MAKPWRSADEVGPDQPGGDAGEDQRDAGPAQDVGDATEHGDGYPRQRSPSTLRAVRNRPKVIRLR